MNIHDTEHKWDEIHALADTYEVDGVATRTYELLAAAEGIRGKDQRVEDVIEKILTCVTALEIDTSAQVADSGRVTVVRSVGPFYRVMVTAGIFDLSKAEHQKEIADRGK